MGTIKIGTSGFSFKDWKGVFYPPGARQSELFSTYVQYFDAVEINATYYRIPSRKIFESLEERSPKGFEFIVKANKETTHIRKNSTEAVTALIDVTYPLYHKEKLQGFLAQFPYSYRNTFDNRRYLVKLKEDSRDIPLIVEFRHNSWDSPAVYDFLSTNGICYCCVDEPPLQGLLPPQDITTGSIGYARFHGRNAEAWWDSSKGDRYDYLYSEDELAEWLQRIREMNRKTSKMYLFFNNCHAGHAVRNAKMMAELLKGQFNIDTVLQDIPIE